MRLDVLVDVLSLSVDAPLHQAGKKPDEAAAGGITERQRELMALVSEGSTNIQIADRLAVSVATVKAELAQLFDLLGTRRRSDLPARAIRAGL